MRNDFFSRNMKIDTTLPKSKGIFWKYSHKTSVANALDYNIYEWDFW